MEQVAPREELPSRGRLIYYLIGFIILAYSTILTTDDLTQGILVLLCFIPLLLFTGYLHRYGGMGWQWPA